MCAPMTAMVTGVTTQIMIIRVASSINYMVLYFRLLENLISIKRPGNITAEQEEDNKEDQ
jgi:hypothetical protein